MGKPVENEVVLRTRAKEVRALIIEKQDAEKAIEIIKEHEEILTFNFGRGNYLSLLPTIRFEVGLRHKYQMLEKVIQAAVQIYANKENYEELVFFAAASCDIHNLRRALKCISTENYSKTREGDTLLMFFIKFTNLENERYLETLKILVCEYKLPVNQADYRGHTAILVLLKKYDSLHSKGITQYNDVILNAVSVILTRHKVDLTSHNLNGKTALDIIESYDLERILKELTSKKENIFFRIKSEKEDERSILFALLAQKKEKEFLQTIKYMGNEKDIFNVEDGNNTLLQLACEKNLKAVVIYLIEQGVDLSKTTNRNRKTPLEIAARRNYYAIFKELLNAKKIIIDLKLFTVFLLNRGRQIKTKYFDEILCYDGLQVDIRYDNGKTPLHYAIMFGNTEAVLKLLKRGASLLVKNDYGKSSLDYISKEDLSLYFDQCILLDNHNKTHSNKYEVRFDFEVLLQSSPDTKQGRSEVEVISKICSSNELKCLATHPLLLAFMETKWNLISPLYNNVLAIYGLLFVYYFILTFCIGHMTFLLLVTISLLIFFKLQTIDFKNKKNYLNISFYVIFIILLFSLNENKHVSTFILMVILLYQFLQQHLYFSKYQALVVNGIRKITPHAVALISLYYLSNFENHMNNKIILSIIVYMLIVTYSFNALFDSVGDIEHTFKVLYNRETLNFIKFVENVYDKFDTILSNPFIKESLKITAHESKRNKSNKLYLHYFINKNKFVNENFHFLKLDVVTVKSLQEFVKRVIQNSQNRAG